MRRTIKTSGYLVSECLELPGCERQLSRGCSASWGRPGQRCQEGEQAVFQWAIKRELWPTPAFPHHLTVPQGRGLSPSSPLQIPFTLPLKLFTALHPFLLTRCSACTSEPFLHLSSSTISTCLLRFVHLSWRLSVSWCDSQFFFNLWTSQSGNMWDLLVGASVCYRNCYDIVKVQLRSLR